MAHCVAGEPAFDVVRQQDRVAVFQNGLGGISDEAALVAQGEDPVKGLTGIDRTGFGGQAVIGPVDIHHHAAKGVVAMPDNLTDGEASCVNLGHGSGYDMADDADPAGLFIFLTEWLGADDLGALG